MQHFPHYNSIILRQIFTNIQIKQIQRVFVTNCRQYLQMVIFVTSGSIWRKTSITGFRSSGVSGWLGLGGFRGEPGGGGGGGEGEM